MTDRYRGCTYRRARNRAATILLMTFAVLGSHVGAADAAVGQDVPIANQPVQASGPIEYPPQFADESHEHTKSENAQQTTPPQESAGLGQPAATISPRDAALLDEADSSAGTRFDPTSSDMLQVLGALAIVISLMFLTRYLFVRASKGLGGAGRPSGVVEILARYPVARGQQLILLKLARRVLLVHQNGNAMTTLSEVVEPNEVAALLGRIEAGSVKKDSGFKSIFNRFASEHDQVNGSSGSDVGGVLNSRRASAGMSNEQGEIIDLTRRPGGLRGLFNPKGASQ